MLAYPADAPRWHTRHQRKGGHILSDHGACGNETMFAQYMAADDGRVGADRGTALDQSLAELTLSLDLGARINDIGEHAGGTAEDPVLERHPFVNRNIILDLAVFADRHIGTDGDVLPDHTIRTDLHAAENMAEMPN